MFFPQQPFLVDFYPVVGPISGGTQLTLIGNHLDAGVQAVFTLKDVDGGTSSIDCKFVDRQSWNSSICVTSAGVKPFHSRSVLFSIDNSTIPHSLPAHGFLVVADPVIRAVSPERTIMRSMLI